MSGPARFGLTWWGQRWIEALEALGAVYANRLPRGRTYARKGTVAELKVAAGVVTARVQGSRARPYRVELRLPVFDAPTWEAVIVALASRIRVSAALLDAQMPEDVDELLAEHGVSLFPTARELATSCSCPDVANPCKHVAAVHYVLAQTFDADPFLLMALRGRERGELLAALAAARAGPGGGPGVLVHDDADDAPLTVDALRAGELLRARGELTAITVRPQPPQDAGAFLRQLGPPPGPAGLDGELQAVVRAAAEAAWELIDQDPDPVRSALGRLGSASARELAALLDEPIETVRAQLRRHRAQGTVRTTGRGPATRYHPVP